MMVFLNSAEKHSISKASYEVFLRLLAPFAPHLTEELWSLSHQTPIRTEPWPDYDHNLAKDEQVTIGVQFNGKVRGDITIAPDATEEVVMEEVRQSEQLGVRLNKIEVKKIIYVPGRILNIVGKEE
jgi:leucyl-tRNA synthetase